MANLTIDRKTFNFTVEVEVGDSILYADNGLFENLLFQAYGDTSQYNIGRTPKETQTMVFEGVYVMRVYDEGDSQTEFVLCSDDKVLLTNAILTINKNWRRHFDEYSGQHVSMMITEDWVNSATIELIQNFAFAFEQGILRKNNGDKRRGMRSYASYRQVPRIDDGSKSDGVTTKRINGKVFIEYRLHNAFGSPLPFFFIEEAIKAIPSRIARFKKNINALTKLRADSSMGEFSNIAEMSLYLLFWELSPSGWASLEPHILMPPQAELLMLSHQWMNILKNYKPTVPE